MSFFDVLSGIGNLLQKPQSIYMGGQAGLQRMFDSSQDRENRLGVGTNPLSGLLAGLRGNIHPHEVAAYLGNNYDQKHGVGQGIANSLFDVAFDPLNAAGPALGDSTKLASLTHVGEDATAKQRAIAKILEKAGPVYHGTIATGDPLTGLGAGLLGEQVGKVGTRVATKLFPETMAKLLPKAVDEAITTAPEISNSLNGVQSAIRLNPKDFLGTAEAVSTPARAVGTREMTNLIDSAVGGNGAAPVGKAPSLFYDLNEGIYTPAERAKADAIIAQLRGRPVVPSVPEIGADTAFDMPSSMAQVTGADPQAVAKVIGTPEPSVSDLINEMYKGGKFNNQRMTLQAFADVLRRNGIR